jgi:DNA-binding ferritin-like protein
MTDNTARKAHDFAEDAAAQAGDLVDDIAARTDEFAGTAAATAGDLADQARRAVNDTINTAKSALDDVDTGAVLASAQEFAAGARDKLSAAYKRNPALVIAVGSAALAAVAALGSALSKRR